MALLSGLSKSRKSFFGKLRDIISFRREVDETLLEEIEEVLISSDIGVDLSLELIEKLKERARKEKLKTPDQIVEALKQGMKALLQPDDRRRPAEEGGRPHVIIMIGINGAGKTTTAGKLTRLLQKQGKSVILAACDTFRAGAIDQLKIWGRRNDTPVVAHQAGADSASVAYDALASARSRNADVLIADTAGRLHTKSNLMAELAKIRKVLLKQDPDAHVDSYLVLDGTGGQNSVNQAREFHQASAINGLIITKLDGTARGGAVFTVCRELNVPVVYLGTGETIDDLEPFDVHAFVDSFFRNDGTC